ncbi:hypothetical protein GF362_05390 [Candidatus Dojkabacteria bacterium]|nr:hypothetical protein [Candidatus Dojkabacteria bacterium]
MDSDKNNNKKIRPALIIITVVITTLLLGYVGISKTIEYKQKKVLGLTSDNLSEYQAVFLDNNQVYFGKVARIDSTFITLRDVYYLQADKKTQNLQEYEKEGEKLSLVALGREVHGPSNEMRINLEHVLFIEDLQKDSKVVNAILSQKQGGN